MSAASTASTLPPVTPICTLVKDTSYMLCEVTASGVVDLPSRGPGPVFVHAAGQPGAGDEGGAGGRAQTLIPGDFDDLFVYMTPEGPVHDRYAGGSATVVTTKPIEYTTVYDVVAIAAGGGAQGRELEWKDCTTAWPACIDNPCGAGSGGAGGRVDAETENSGASGPGTSAAAASGEYSTAGSSCHGEPIGHQPTPGHNGIGGIQTAGGDRDGANGIGGPGGSRNGGIQPWLDADGNPVAADSCNCPAPTGYTAGAGGAWNGHDSAGGGGGNGGGGGGDKAFGGAGGGSAVAAPTGDTNEWTLQQPDPRDLVDLPDWNDPNTEHASVWFFYET
ncbi:MAG: hypothetical protein AAGF73_03030 [Actinomycetota bacterium]